MIIRKPADIRSSEITDERFYLRRREFMRMTGGALVGAAAAGALAACEHAAADSSEVATDAAPSSPQTAFSNITKRLVTTQDPPNTYEQITGYNNFYEFGMGKSDPKR